MVRIAIGSRKYFEIEAERVDTRTLLAPSSIVEVKYSGRVDCLEQFVVFLWKGNELIEKGKLRQRQPYKGILFFPGVGETHLSLAVSWQQIYLPLCIENETVGQSIVIRR